MNVTYAGQSYDCVKAVRDGGKATLYLSDGGTVEFGGVSESAWPQFEFEDGGWWQPPLEEIKTDKIAAVSATCQQTIYNGLDIQLPGGETEHFDYTERDQINIKEMFDSILMGATMYPYQSEDGRCRTYTAAEILTIYPALAGNKTAQLTYYHQLKDYINTLETAEEIEAVTYGQPLTGEYLEHYNEMVAVAAEQMQTVISKITSALSV